MSDWLDLHLSQELQPVRAPEALWARVQAARLPQTNGRRTIMVPVPVLVALALMIGTAALWSRWRPGGFDRLAVRELANSAQLELQSDNALEISAWLRREAGVDVSIPGSARTHLIGARVFRDRGVLVGEVAYTVGGRDALLLISHSGGPYRAPRRHGGPSWEEQQQVYAVACSSPDLPQAACALCHANL